MRLARRGGALAVAAAAALAFGYAAAEAQERGTERQAEATPPRVAPAAELRATSQQAQLRASGAFLQLGSVEGESRGRAGGKNKEIDILSWSWGSSRAGQGGSGGRVALHGVDQVTLSKRVDKATPKLAEAVTRGQKVGTVVLEARPRGGGSGDYVRYTLHDAVVSSLSRSGTSGSDEVPTETISLSFSKIEVDYRSSSLKGMLGEPATQAETSRKQ